MKLENNLLNISMPQSDRVQEPSKAQSQASGRAQSAQTAGDGVDLGNQAGLVATAQAAGLSDRSSITQSLRALVQSGQYKVDTAALAYSMVSAAQYGD
jgi:anti-sigma28 factor (negative regulator of flagellin synthesis)